jgi:septum formation protein
VAALHPEAVVIGSDQVADLDGEAIGKPGTTNAPPNSCA